MVFRAFLLFFLSFSVKALCGVGESKDEIRARFHNIIFSARETLPRGPVHEQYDYRGHKVEVHYENHLSATEVVHGINSEDDAHRMLSLTQISADWRIVKKEGKIVEWESGPLRARLEKNVLRVSAAKVKEPQ